MTARESSLSTVGLIILIYDQKWSEVVGANTQEHSEATSVELLIADIGGQKVVW